jgi:Arc/MetJ family transcription regulator
MMEALYIIKTAKEAVDKAVDRLLNEATEKVLKED